MDEAKMLEQHQFPVLVQAVEHFVADIFLQDVSDLFDIVLGDGARRFDALEMVEEVGMLEQQLLEVMLGPIDNFLLVIIVDLLAIVFGQCLEAFATHEQDTHFGQLLAGCNEASLFE